MLSRVNSVTGNVAGLTMPWATQARRKPAARIALSGTTVERRVTRMMRLLLLHAGVCMAVLIRQSFQNMEDIAEQCEVPHSNSIFRNSEIERYSFRTI